MKLNRMIDHTLLKPEATTLMIEKLCQEAMKYQFKSVMVNSGWVKFCKELLRDEPDVLVGCTIGFPLGASSSEVKAFEAQQAIYDGADEVDMVINIGALIDEDYDKVVDDILAVKRVCGDTCLKVIIETCLLNEKQKKAACECVNRAFPSFIKTSTGFSSHGATVDDVKLLREFTDSRIDVKAAGGVRSKADALAMVEAGATRLGTSSGVKIMQEDNE